MSLLKIQSELKAPKEQFNSFGKYKYRNCEDILEAVKPLLLKYDMTMTISDELVNIGDRYYVKATVTLQSNNDDKKIVVSAYAREEETKKGMDGSQVTGTSSSYARKYALNGLFLIDDTKDSDTTNTHGKDTADKKPEYKPVPVDPMLELKAQKVELQKVFKTRDEYVTWRQSIDADEKTVAGLQLIVDELKKLNQFIEEN